MSSKRVCVFCGSSDRVSPEYLEIAARVGRLLADREMTLIYGGADVGMMGALAKASLDAGGSVIGVIPRAINDRVGHRSLSETVVVETMHERKAKMHELADCFLALPGGLGTMEELFEALTWQQLGYHAKPCGILNSGEFYDALLRFLDHLVEENFLKLAHRELVLVDEDPHSLLERIQHARPKLIDKWKDD